jgi:hypothetical protein
VDEIEYSPWQSLRSLCEGDWQFKIIISKSSKLAETAAMQCEILEIPCK